MKRSMSMPDLTAPNSGSALHPASPHWRSRPGDRALRDVDTRFGVVSPEPPRRAVRAANVELLGLLACSAIVLIGVLLTCSARIARLAGEEPYGGERRAGSAVHLRDV